MVSGTSEQLLRIAAWPIHTVHSKPGGRVTGFLMPRASEYQEIHVLHGPKSRMQKFSRAGWPFLIHTATNLARAFLVLHQHGHVAGDVNNRNLLVSQSATVKLIDCDSFQIKSAGRTFYCEVGTEDYTPPELQGKSFRGVIRTPNHDVFGLAVLIFQLLFMGKHPFTGTPVVLDDIGIERAIREYRFAYGPKAASRGMQPPPASLPLSAIPAQLSTYFDRAFSAPGAHYGRPGPQEWLKELNQLERNLRQCSSDASHHYYNSLNSCPWCEIQNAHGVTLFTAVIVAAPSSKASKEFDVDTVWARIESIRSPGPLPSLPTGWTIIVNPSADIVALGRKRRRRNALTGVTGVGALGAIAVVSPPGWVIFVVVFVVFLVLRANWYRSDDIEMARSRIRGDLKRKVEEYKDLPGLRSREIQRLEVSALERQLQAYFQSYRIHDADIPGIGASRVAMLQSYGFETAADVSNALQRVPGFGPVLTGNLLSWRRDLERRFRFNPSKALPRAEVTRIDFDIADKRSRLIREIQYGARDIEKLIELREQILAKREAIEPLLEPALRAVR